VAVGFSMSGNILLKFLAETGSTGSAQLRGALAVNPAVDLAACVAKLEERQNRLYNKRFVRLLLKQRRLNAKRAGQELDKIRAHSLREYDTLYTAPRWGFASAEDYYERASAAPLLEQISTRTTILTAADDPIVPIQSLPGQLSDSTELLAVPAGGHMGFLAAGKTPLGNRRWLDWMVLSIAERLLGNVHQ
jgi:predicted alpha/beta-fold hydrolase